MSKEDVMQLIDLICRLNPGWKENVDFATELIERDQVPAGIRGGGRQWQNIVKKMRMKFSGMFMPH